MLMVVLDPADPRPLFRQIVDEVHRAVATGILKADDPLPPVRELAKHLRINPNTVQQAYRELERSGGAYVRRGVGTFVAQVPRQNDARRTVVAKQLASRFLREGFRHGLLASDLLAALQAIAPGLPDKRIVAGPSDGSKVKLTAAEDRVPTAGRLGFDG